MPRSQPEDDQLVEAKAAGLLRLSTFSATLAASKLVPDPV